MDIRKAAICDIDSIMQLYQAAIERMQSAGIDQWDTHYPSPEIILNDINHQQLWAIYLEGALASVFVLNGDQEAEYANGCWRCSGPHAVIHRLCVHPRMQGQGFGRLTMKAAESLAAANGYASIRLDAYSQNPAALRLYEGLGYQRVGEAAFRKGLFYLYEKNLPL